MVHHNINGLKTSNPKPNIPGPADNQGHCSLEMMASDYTEGYQNQLFRPGLAGFQNPKPASILN